MLLFSNFVDIFHNVFKNEKDVHATLKKTTKKRARIYKFLSDAFFCSMQYELVSFCR
jgi:hypothetical protein